MGYRKKREDVQNGDKEPGIDRAAYRTLPLAGVVKVVRGNGLPEMEQKCAEEVCPVGKERDPAGQRSPVKDRCGKCRNPHREVREPHFDLELGVLLCPAHPGLVGFVIDRMPEEAERTHNPDEEGGEDPEPKAGIDKEKVNSQKDPDH